MWLIRFVLYFYRFCFLFLTWDESPDDKGNDDQSYYCLLYTSSMGGESAVMEERTETVMSAASSTLYASEPVIEKGNQHLQFKGRFIPVSYTHLEEYVAENYDKSIEELTWHLIKEQLVEANNIDVYKRQMW